MNDLKVILQRLMTKNPKLFAKIQVFAILLELLLVGLPLFGVNVDFVPDAIYNGIMWLSGGVIITSQITTTNKALLKKDKNHNI